MTIRARYRDRTMDTRGGFRVLLRLALIAAPLSFLSGCGRSPVFNVLGSYFPGWIACIVLGIIVAVIVRTLLHRRELERRIAALPLFYLSVALLVACAFWLIAFE